MTSLVTGGDVVVHQVGADDRAGHGDETYHVGQEIKRLARKDGRVT